MWLEKEFQNDCEFQKLLLRGEEIDVTTAALELARDAYPKLDFDEIREWIRVRAMEVASERGSGITDRDGLLALGRCLYGRLGIRGSREAYQSAEGSYLNRVIATKQGIPISLSVLYMAVANEAGIPLQGVAAPGHFLTRLEADEGPLFVDAFGNGDVLDIEQTYLRIQVLTGLSPQDARSALNPVAPRIIIIRMLNNLKALLAQQQNWSAAWKVQCRLAALQPSAYEEIRDLGLISLKTRRHSQAVSLLQQALQNCPLEERTALEKHLSEAHRQLSQWN